MLRALPDAAVVGERLARAVAAIAPVDRAQQANVVAGDGVPAHLQGAIA